MCGIFAIYSSENIHINFFISILEQLKHRGKDSYGITFYDSNKNINHIKSLTTIQNYDKSEFHNIRIALTHNRYSTVKKKSNVDFLQQIQPIHFKNNHLEFDLVHNGNISNIQKYISYDDNLSDTQNIIQFFSNTTNNDFENQLIKFINTIHCSYSIIILFKETLYVLKDRYGYKPLYLGKLQNQYCVISEDNISCFQKIREVNSGEIIKIDSSGYNTIYHKSAPIGMKCIFEYIYFMNEKTSYNNVSVYNIRYNLGKNLASMEQFKFDKNNTIVVGSPNTAIPMGKGYAKYLNLNYLQILKKQTDCGRTFILKDQKSRNECCKKFIFDEHHILNKTIILVDDSIVRGNTIKNLSQMFHNFKCKELHIRVCSPQLKFPCYYGIDIPTHQELIVNNHNLQEIQQKFNLSSLQYISIEKMLQVFNNQDDFCCACFDGKYNKELDW